jgi:hypothetical protein
MTRELLRLLTLLKLLTLLTLLTLLSLLTLLTKPFTNPLPRTLSTSSRTLTTNALNLLSY